ncbi:transcription factor MYC1-like [Chenopodium quinoa]|uniref:transcription factor MYC1-like n=1 Tax=Chenopodium quinoa TaxID=63459 RepID=UPI000B783EFB|nr:transcription factor MYC1-like [Chenopodium quinoa]
MIIEDQEIQTEILTKQQLALAVRSSQWSYAVFWSLSTAEQGVLEWGEGYYNGHIKTRKSVHNKDVDNHKLGLERSEQLRKLYEALLEGESEQGAKKLSLALSLEDLSDLEWYYLVSMSFTFKVGQSLPGRALATGQHIWLYDTQSADSKLFTRSLLAKSASIQTVVCFPHKGGVIELGVTDLVLEDISFIQHIKTALVQPIEPDCSPKASSVSQKEDSDKDHVIANITENEDEMVDILPFSSLHNSAEQIKFDEDIENGLYQSVLEEFIGSPGDCSNDSSHHAEESFYSCTSTFMPWKKELTADNFRMQESQNTLKKVLFRVPLIKTNRSNSGRVNEDEMQDYPMSPQTYDVYKLDFALQETTANLLLSELEEKKDNPLYMVQESMIPSITEEKHKNLQLCLLVSKLIPALMTFQMDEAFILTDSTKYLAGVEELETSIDLEGTGTAKDLDMLEQNQQAYDIYSKSMASEINEIDPNSNKAIQTEILQPLDIDIEVSIEELEVLITMKCPWRECLLIRIMEVLSNLNLETHSVQSSTLNGILSVFLKSKFQKAAFASEGMIKEALSRTIGTC